MVVAAEVTAVLRAVWLSRFEDVGWGRNHRLVFTFHVSLVVEGGRLEASAVTEAVVHFQFALNLA